MSPLAGTFARLLPAACDQRSDGELVAAFTDHRDEAAFAELVRLHGAVVRSACRRMLPNPPDADDAFQATFLVLAPEHAKVAELTTTEQRAEVEAYVAAAGRKTDVERQQEGEKTGVFTGSFATHPISGHQLPIWIADYVLISYGTGSIMAVPAHDERDFAFANKYGIEIVQVVLVDGEPHFDYHRWQDWYADKTRGVTINSDNFSGMHFKEAVAAVAHALQQKGLGETQTTWRLRDWGVSRQRYWGTPIPIIHCAEHGAVPVPEQDLPVVLPRRF